LKRVLIISYYWPPAGGISIIRPLKLAKYLGDSGWEPVICTAQNPHYPFQDDNAFVDIPEGIEIIKVPIVEPYEIYKRLTGQKQKSALADVIQNAPKRSFLHKLSIWVRGNFFIPDARCLWVKPVVKQLSAYLKDNPVDAIITTGPPHSVNRIGYLLKKKFNLPWIADFQDPWTQVDYYQHFKISSWAHKRHRKMENQVFDNADLITIVSDSWKIDLKKIGAKDVEVIPLGYDPDDFTNSVDLDSYFTISHLGLLGQDRNPSSFLKVVKDLCTEDQSFAEQFRLQLVGKVNVELQNQITDLKLEEQVIYRGQVNRMEALKMMQASHLLLLLLNKAGNVSGRIPGKVFEYIGAKRPILSLGPEGTDIGRMLHQSNSGEQIDYENQPALKEYLALKFDEFKSNGNMVSLNSSNCYSHKEVSSTFAAYLEKLIKK
jgi:glycosyltransferase involved in cell wall biosynthesis